MKIIQFDWSNFKDHINCILKYPEIENLMILRSFKNLFKQAMWIWRLFLANIWKHLNQKISLTRQTHSLWFIWQGEKAARSQRDLISMFTKGGSVEFRHRTRDENEVGGGDVDNMWSSQRVCTWTWSRTWEGPSRDEPGGWGHFESNLNQPSSNCARVFL